MKKDTLDKALHMFDKIEVDKMTLKPSEYAEKNRTLTSDVSTVQGRFKYSLTPYMKEIVDCLSPYHPAKIVGLMKGAQCGATEGVIVNGILWIIANNPGNVLMLSATDDLSKEMVEGRLDQGIQSCGIQHLIRPNTIRKRNQRTGDTSKSKEYAGGRAYFGGYNSINKLVRQRSIRLGIFDDWDAAPLIDKEEGNLFTLLQKRFNTAKYLMKQFYISTPKTRPSNTEMVYLMGDQRKWHVPCPMCGVYIEIKWYTNKDGKEYGITFDKDDKGKLIENSVGYICQECGDFFEEKHKYDMNLQGKWIPTAKPERPGFYSYQLNSFTAAPHMMGWTDFAHEWVDIHRNEKPDIPKLKAFINQIMGEPWEERKVEIKSNVLKQNTRGYEIGTVPNLLSKNDGNGNIILLTCACDLNGTIDDARLDWEVMGHSENGSTYSIIHGSIGTYQPKDKSDRAKRTYRPEMPNNVWDPFYNDIIAKMYVTDEGNELGIMMTGIDTGYFAHYCYSFIDQYPGKVIGVRGKEDDKFRKSTADTATFRPAKERAHLYLLESDTLKDELAEKINLRWTPGDMQPPGFMNFPNTNGALYTEKYFNEYTNETKQEEINDTGDVVGWKWVRKHTSAPNHFWDVAHYNLAVRDIFIKKFCKEMGVKEGGWIDFVNYIVGIING